MLAAPGCGGGEDGTSTTASTSFAPKPAEGGGEKSIEEFGEGAGGAARTAIVGSFEGYLEALAAEAPAAACAHLAASVQRSLERFAPRALKRKGCPALLPKLLAPSAPAISREQAKGEITRVRIDGERGFVIFRAPGARLYQMPMVRQPNGWKVGLVAAAVLVPEL